MSVQVNAVRNGWEVRVDGKVVAKRRTMAEAWQVANRYLSAPASEAAE